MGGGESVDVRVDTECVAQTRRLLSREVGAGAARSDGEAKAASGARDPRGAGAQFVGQPTCGDASRTVHSITLYLAPDRPQRMLAELTETIDALFEQGKRLAVTVVFAG
jgi:hypothetical protein